MSSTTEDRLEGEAGPLDEGAVRAAFKAAVLEDGLSTATAAKEAGIPYGTFSSWVGGTYGGRTERIARAAQSWLTGRAARAKAKTALPSEPPFALTQTASRIWEVLEFAQTMPTIGVVIGNAGVGKTIALKGYRDRHPNTVWIATMQPCDARPYPALQRIAGALNVFPDGRASTLSDRVVRKLEGTRGLVIIDEAQHLETTSLDQIRSIFDAALVGVVLAGNRDLAAHMDIDRRRDQLAQISRRVGMRMRTIERPRKADIATLLTAWNVEGEEARAELQAIALRPGGVGVMTMVLRIAFVLAAASQGPLAVEHVRVAWQQLSGGGA
jgi:hypothetical protein